MTTSSRVIASIVLILTSAFSTARASQQTVDADLVLLGGMVIDGRGGEPIADGVVAIRGRRIVAVGARDDVVWPEDARVIEVAGRTVLPGFINAHAHTRYIGLEETAVWVRAGVTTVRDLGGPIDELVRRRRDSATRADLPRLRVAGPMLTAPGGHPIPIYGPDYPAVAVSGVENARATVDALIDAGANQIKIAVSGRTDTGWPELTDEEIRAITETAHARGVRVSAHVDTAAGLRRAVENEVDDAAHAPRDGIPDDLIALMVERGVALIPTIDVYQNLAEEAGNRADWDAYVLPLMLDSLRRFVAAGGTVALGDDFGNPGVGLGMPVDEIAHWLDAGLEPMTIIVAATWGGAIVCGLEDDLGTLEPGKLADVLVVDGDPLAEIGALARPVLVIRNGEIAYEESRG